MRKSEENFSPSDFALMEFKNCKFSLRTLQSNGLTSPIKKYLFKLPLIISQL